MVRSTEESYAHDPTRSRSRQPKQLDAGIFQAEISSFALRLAAEGKAAKTIRTYTEAVQWFAATGPCRQAGAAGSRSPAATSSGGWRGCWPLQHRVRQ